MSERPDNRNDWIQYSNLTESQRRLMRKRSANTRLAFAIGIIGLGVLLFLGNLGLLPNIDIWILWPLLPIAGGISRLTSAPNSSARVWGILMVLFGALFLCFNFGWIHIRANDGSWPISLLLIGIGCAALFSVLESSKKTGDGAEPGLSWTCRLKPQTTSENFLNDFAILGSLKRRMESPAFSGGNIITIFGSVEVDLRHAVISLAEKSAIINVTAVFGAIKLKVPADWRVHVNGASILGNFEDKTLPPSNVLDTPTLVITGLSTFASVEIED